MPLTITKRLDKGAPLTPTEMDDNLQEIKDKFDALEAAQSVALNNDGTLKAGAINNINNFTAGVLDSITLPVGTIIGTTHATLGTNAGADGFIYLDGSSQLRTGNFADFFALVGTTYGPGNNPGTTFALPDFRGRYLCGVSPGSLSGGRNTARILAEEVATPYGEEKHVLTTAELAPHTHAIDSRNYDAGGGQSTLKIISETAKWTGSINSTSTGSINGGGLTADAHNTLPCSATVRWLAKL